MAGSSDYNICISLRDDNAVPTLETVSQLVDFLDYNLYLDGPDRDASRLVRLPIRETKEWQNYLRRSPDDLVPTIRKRYVNLLYSPTTEETLFRHYGELSVQVLNVRPRDASIVASLGAATRRLSELCTVANDFDPDQRWIQSITVHTLRGYHALWSRVWDEAAQHKTWELRRVKGFTFMLSCKLNPKAEVLPLETYLARLWAKPEFQSFLEKLGDIIGDCNFELIGELTS